MGHLIEYMDFKESATEVEIKRARANFIDGNGDRDPSDGYLLSHDSGFTLHNIVCESYEEAVEKIESLDKGWYDDHGVKYKHYKGQSKAMIANRDKIRENRERKSEYIKNNSVRNRKADTITCPECKSRLSLAYLRGQDCPLCKTDLRSETVKKRIAAFDKKEKELDKEYAELEKKQAYEIRWLVKLEIHV